MRALSQPATSAATAVSLPSWRWRIHAGILQPALPFPLARGYTGRWISEDLAFSTLLRPPLLISGGESEGRVPGYILISWYGFAARASFRYVGQLDLLAKREMSLLLAFRAWVGNSDLLYYVRQAGFEASERIFMAGLPPSYGVGHGAATNLSDSTSWRLHASRTAPVTRTKRCR